MGSLGSGGGGEGGGGGGGDGGDRRAGTKARDGSMTSGETRERNSGVSNRACRQP